LFALNGNSSRRYPTGQAQHSAQESWGMESYFVRIVSLADNGALALNSLDC
jgi:hypothetical protein